MDGAHKVIVALRVFPDARVQAFGYQVNALLGNAQSKTHVMLDALAQRATHFENEWIKIRDRAFGKASESRNSGKGAGSDGKAKPPRPPKQSQNAGDQKGKGNDAPDREDRWANRNRNGKGKKPIPHDYEEEEQFHFPETLTPCADGSFRGPLGEPARQIGVDTVTELNLKPAEYCLSLHHYPRFFCDESQTFHQAPRKQRLLGSTWVGNAFVANAIVSKYLDGLPFYRQAKIHEREGLKIDRSTLIRWSNMVGGHLKSLWEVLISHIRGSVAVFADETTVRVLQHGAGKAKQRYAFVVCRDERRWNGNAPPAVAFLAPRPRTEASARELLGNFHGLLHSDGLAAYERIGETMVHQNCWAHARRGIFEIWKRDKGEIAEEILNEIDRLFILEREVAGRPADERLAFRRKHSEAVVKHIYEKCDAALEVIAGGSTLATAIRYIVKRQRSLARFLEDGRVEIDNNLVENCIRPYAIVRKNVMFAGSERGADNWAVLASLLGTAAMNGINPRDYLIWVMDRLDDKLPLARLEELLPWHFPGARSEQRANAHREDAETPDTGDDEGSDDANADSDNSGNDGPLSDE